MDNKAATQTLRTASMQVTLRRRLLPVLVAGCFGTAFANPLGPQVINGQAGFLTQGNVLSVTNTPGTIINWQSFSINPGELTRFIQQNPNSAVLNRIIGQDPSQILGALQSNGRVFLVNPNGILFGQGAQVDVNGLVASTLNISNEDFLNGKMLFKAGDKAGNLKNEGAITTPSGGQVYLIAPNVENSGLITSPKGDVMLAAGHTVQLVDSMNPDVRVVLSAPEHEALNLGQVIAQGGRTGVYGALVKQRGIINADSAVVGENGKVILKSSRDTLVEAGSRTTAKGTGKGGEIQVLGERVGLFGDANISVNGDTGGGTILIGGDYQGQNPEVANAKQVVVAKEAQINANALAIGDGGKIIVWSDEVTRFHGAISARGGEFGGNGGFVETSGKHLDMQGHVDTRAPQGNAGTLLLDPTNIYIANTAASATAAGMSGTNTSADLSGPTAFVASGAVIDSLLTTNTLQTALGSSSVTVSTSNATGTGEGAIRVVDPISWGTGSSLTLSAATDITVNASISNTSSGALNLFGNGDIAVNSTIAVGGNFSVAGTSGGTTQSTSFTGNAQVSGFDLAIRAGQIDLTTLGTLIAKQNTDLTASNIDINGALIHSPGSSTFGLTTLTASGNIGLQGTIEGVGPGGYTVKLRGGTIATGAGKLLTVNGAGESTVIEVDNGGTWNNYGQVSLTGSSQIRLFDDNGSLPSEFRNNNGAQFNSSSTSGWVFFSPSDVGSVRNDGAMAINSNNQSFEAKFNQGALGSLTLGASRLISLQNAQDVRGTINFTDGGTVWVSEYHGSPATFTNTVFSGAGTLDLHGASFPVQAVLTNVSAPNTALAIGSLNGGSVKITGGTSTFSSATGLDNGVTLNNGSLTVANNLSVPAGVTYLGNVGYSSTGTLSVPAGTSIGTTGNVSLQGSQVSLASTSSVSGANIGIKAPVLNVGGTVTATGDVTLKTDALALNNTVTGSIIQVHPVTPGRSITVGSSTCMVTPCLAVYDLYKLAAPTVGIGSDDAGDLSGDIHVAAITNSGGTVTSDRHASTTRIGLLTGGGVTQSNAIEVPDLGVVAGGAVTLPQNNLVSNFAAELTGLGQSLTFNSSNPAGLTVGSLTGGSVSTGSDYAVVGVTANGGDITLNASSGPLNVGSVIDTVSGDVILNAAGNITVGANVLTGPAGTITAVSSGNIAVSSTMDAGASGVVTLTATTGAISGTGTVKGSFLNTQASGGIALSSQVSGFFAENTGMSSNISLVNTGALTLYDVTQSTAGSTGGISISNTGALMVGVESVVSTKGGPISLVAHSPLTIDGTVSSVSGNINLQASGTGSSATGDTLTIGASGSVTSTTGNITLSAGNGIVGMTTSNVVTSGSISATANTNITVNTPPPPPTVDQCVADPTLSGCSTVLPTLATCTTAPTTTGCSAVLPTVDTCVANPTQTGCTAVLPTLDVCTTSPATTGCSVVLPTLATCTTAPTTPGCGVVLPTIATCTTAPTTPGCTVVLPTVDACTVNPTQAGCTVVLPPLSICTTAPTTPGCTAVLPTVDACTINPTQAGCSVVLPTLSSCTSNPAQAGCSVVLPSMTACTTTPTLAGCTAVLPTLTQCAATPTLEGCSVVVPTASQCIINPSAPECQVVLPVTNTGSDQPPANTITVAVNETTNTVVMTTQAAPIQASAGSGSSSGGSSKPSENSDEKKDEKRTTSTADDSGAKKNEPVKKMYCN